MDSEIQTQMYLYISFTVSTFKFVLSRHHWMLGNLFLHN